MKLTREQQDKKNAYERARYARLRSTPELREEQAKKSREKYQRTKEWHHNYHSQRPKELREWVQTLKGPCIACGESDPVVIDFHHRDPKTKDKEIARMCGQRMSRAKIKEEIDKCVCLCSNCHRKVHANTLTLL